MELLKTHALTPEQIADIRALEDACRRAEPFGRQAFLSAELNFHPEMDCFFLLYEGADPAGFLSLFQPEQAQAELTALVHPAYRRRGCFTRMLAAARAELARCGVPGLLYCHEPVCKSGAAVLKTLSVALDHSEFRLEYDRALPPAPAPAGLLLERAGRALLPAVVSLSAAAFGASEADTAPIVERFFSLDTVVPYAAWLDGALAGHLCRNIEGGEVYLCNVCVHPAHQGKGVGRGILLLALERVLAETEGPIRLEVDSQNPRAHRLYLRCGFREKTRCDYYSEI